MSSHSNSPGEISPAYSANACYRVAGARFAQRSAFSAEEFRTSHENHADVIFPARAIGRVDQLSRDVFGIAVVGFHDGADFGGHQRVAQSVAAQQQRRIVAERQSVDFNEIFSLVRVSRPGAHLAKHLIAAGMAHGLLLGEFAHIFTLTNR